MALPREVWGVLASARKWAVARAACAKLADSRSTKPADMEKAKSALAQASHELFKAVQEFETFLKKPQAKKNSSFDWAGVFGMIAKGAGMLEEVATATRSAPRIHKSVIDTHGEEIPE